MFGKLEISGCIESLTGLHIGGGSQFAAIGAVDSVVVKDIDDDLPMIPGSSLGLYYQNNLVTVNYLRSITVMQMW